jgi:hypothetical protein
VIDTFFLEEKFDGKPEICQTKFATFIVVCLEALFEFVRAHSGHSLIELTQAWAANQTVTQDGNVAAAFWEDIIKKTNSAEVHVGNSNAMVVEGRETIDFGSLEGKALTVQSGLEFLLKSRYPETSNRLAKTIFFFDEAAQLVDTRSSIAPWTRFQILRRSLRVLGGNKSCFAFFTDTVSTISNFAPSTRWERSSRLTNPVGMKLFPPFWWLPTMDVWPGTRDDHLKVCEWEHPIGYFRFGRPAYFAYLGPNPEQREDVAPNAKKLLGLVANKLMNVLPSLQGDVTFDQALAILGVRTTLSVTASCQLAKKLTASHMRLCVGVSADRESIYSFQYPEPALALASMKLIAEYGWLPMLEHLREAMSLIVINAGSRGELGVQNLLLMAVDRLMICKLQTVPESWKEKADAFAIHNYTIPTLPVLDLLKVLLDTESAPEMLLKDKFADRVSLMYFRLVQFVKVFAKPGKKQIFEMFKRAAGIVVKNGAAQVDLIIPILVLRKGEILADVVPVPERMSVLLIQIKCYSNSRSTNAEGPLCSVGLTRERSTASLPENLDYVSLLIEVGPHASNKHRCTVFSRKDLANLPNMINPSLDPKQLSAAIYGLRPSALLASDHPERSSLDECFQKLMTECFDPVKIKDSSAEAIENLKLSLGLIYNSYSPLAFSDLRRFDSFRFQ